MRARGRRWAAGLGLLAGAFLHQPLAAQAVPSDTSHRADTTRAPADTGARPAVPLPSDTLPKDTIKAPFAQSERPPLIGIALPYEWDRSEIFSSGGLMLADVLARIPGASLLRSGWLGAPQYIAYVGNPGRVRVFLDGIEIDPLDPRSPGALDLSALQPWSTQDIAVERGADELRVYMRSWSVDRVAPQTRADVLTGDQGTNLYRGFYGKRFHNGLGIQLGARSYGTNGGTDIGGGNELAFIGRLGWAKGRWSLDAFASRASRTRDEEIPAAGTGYVAPQKRTRTDAYVRGGWGNPEAGAWAQLMVAREEFHENTNIGAGTALQVPDSADTTRAETQYVAAAGLTKWGLRLSATNRLHVLPGKTFDAVVGRVAFENPVVAISAYAEHRTGDTSSVQEVSARLTPLSFFALSGTASRRSWGPETAGNGSGIAFRAEAGLRVSRAWVSGGVLRRPATLVPGLVAYDTSLAPMVTQSATGVFGRVRGKFYQDLGLDVSAVRWDGPGFYRPQNQTHEELYLDTRWLRRFPSGNFGFLGSISHEFRNDVLFPALGGPGETFGPGSSFAFFSHVLRSRVEVRILDATIFWYSEYALNPRPYEYVPGFRQPVRRMLYGARWSFQN